MNKTQTQFMRLGDSIVRRFNVEVGGVFNFSDRYHFYRKENEYIFQYYGVFINVGADCFWISLPNHIDIADFNKSILLKDMWYDLINYNPIEKIMMSVAPMLATTFQSMGKAFLSISGNLLTISRDENEEPKK